MFIEKVISNIMKLPRKIKTKNEDFDQLMNSIKAFAFAKREKRKEIQKYGIDIIPVGYYSGIPSIAEIENSFEYKENLPFFDSRVYNEETLLNQLKTLNEYSSEFNPALEGDEQSPNAFFWKNSQFSYSDAMALYTFIRSEKPDTIIEIGSGFSSLLALEALEKNGKGELICIEPYPRDFLSRLKGVQLIVEPIQSITTKRFNSLIRGKTIIFVDSTHTVKAGSDCLHIYLRLLPYVNGEYLLHIHDIFLPEGMPKHWLTEENLYWTEQYLVQSMLLYNLNSKLVFGSNINVKLFPDLMKDFMGKNQIIPGGSSIWIRNT